MAKAFKTRLPRSYKLRETFIRHRLSSAQAPPHHHHHAPPHTAGSPPERPDVFTFAPISLALFWCRSISDGGGDFFTAAAHTPPSQLIRAVSTSRLRNGGRLSRALFFRPVALPGQTFEAPRRASFRSGLQKKKKKGRLATL